VLPINAEAILARKLVLSGNKKLEKRSVIDAFSENFDLISAGDWYPIAKNKRWIGAQTYIELALEDLTQKIQLDIKAKPLIYQGINSQQRMRIYINNNFITETSFTRIIW